MRSGLRIKGKTKLISSVGMVKKTENVTTHYRNTQYKYDIRNAVRVSKTLLTPIGIWPQSDTSVNHFKMFVQTATIFSLMCFLFIPHVIYTYFDCDNLTRYMKVIAAQVFTLLGIIKFWTMIINRKDIRFCLTQMEMQYREVECEEDRLVLLNCARIGQIFIKLYLGLTYGGALPYHVILPLLSEKVVKADNTTQIPLPYLSNYVFFVIEESPIYEITFVLQIIISSIILSTNCGIYSLTAAIMMHTCGLFEIVNRKIETLFVHDGRYVRDRLRNIIQHHLKAIEFTRIIERALTIVFFSEIVGCTLVICFLEFGVIVEWEDRKPLSTVTYFILMTSIFTNVFIISFIGDRLKQESERVGQSTYFIPWYDLPDDVVKNMRTIILRTSHPSTLTAAKLFDLSLHAFCDVCKTSAAYLNFLRAITV